MVTDNKVAIREQGYDLALPDVDTLTRELTAVRSFQMQVKKLLIEGHDFGVIPGTDKPTLFQPGAEKMDKILHLADFYEVIERQEEWQKPFFYYMIRCRLKIIGTDVQVAEGLGSCNSMEDRYRYRWVFQTGLPADMQGDTGKAERDHLPHRTIKTKNGMAKQYRIDNDNIYSLVNTLLKMGRKRAHIAASLSAGRLSDVFTQDMEDIGEAIVQNDEPPASDVSTEHFCIIHTTPFFKKGKMKGYTHPVDGGGWCNEPEDKPTAAQIEQDKTDLYGPPPPPRPAVPVVTVVVKRLEGNGNGHSLQDAPQEASSMAHGPATPQAVQEPLPEAEVAPDDGSVAELFAFVRRNRPGFKTDKNIMDWLTAGPTGYPKTEIATNAAVILGQLKAAHPDWK